MINYREIVQEWFKDLGYEGIFDKSKIIDDCDVDDLILLIEGVAKQECPNCQKLQERIDVLVKSKTSTSKVPWWWIDEAMNDG